MPFWKKKQAESNVWTELFDGAAAAINRYGSDPERATVLNAIVGGGLYAASQTFKQCDIFGEQGN